jgi:hypothetical protein
MCGSRQYTYLTGAPIVDIMIYISPANGTSLTHYMQRELTNRIDLSSNSSPNPTIGLDGQRIIGGGFANDSISEGQANKSKERIFVICDACFWATTYLDKSRLPVLDSRCSRCQEVGLSSFPVLANESFTFAYSEKRGVELRFMNHSG